MTDLILMGCFVVAYFFNKNIYPATLAYAVTCLYIISLFDSHSPVINHVIYGLIFIPPCFAANIRAAYCMLCYSTLQFAVALDYFVYPDVVTPISYIFNYAQIAIALSIICVDFGANYDNSRILRDRFNFISRMGHIWHLQTYLKTEKKAR